MRRLQSGPVRSPLHPVQVCVLCGRIGITQFRLANLDPGRPLRPICGNRILCEQRRNKIEPWRTQIEP
jgi:hypothetical protein